jgi:LysM repeat protein
MWRYSRHASWLAVTLLLALSLSGCYRSIGGSLEPTQANLAQAAVNTPLPLPTMTTPPELAPTQEEITALPSPVIPPTLTPFPTLAPATETPIATQTSAGLPEGQGGALVQLSTNTATAVAMAPTFTSIPTQAAIIAPTSTPVPPTQTPVPPTLTSSPTNVPLPTFPPLPSETPTTGPTATFTAVPFSPFQPTATYTPYVPSLTPSLTPPPVEAPPLGERPTETLPPLPATLEGQGGPVATETPVAIAQVPTLTGGQMTATQLVYMATAGAYAATATAAAQQGVILPSLTPAFGEQGPGPFAPTPFPPNVIIITATPAGQPGICDQYLVQPGETLYRIAARFGVTVQQIADANNILNPDLIKAGYTLQIPCPVPTTPTPVPASQPAGQTGQGGYAGGNVYIVQPGDNIYKLSIRFGVTMQDLMAANGLTAQTMNLIIVGQELIIPPSATILLTPTAVSGQGGPVYIIITNTPTPGFG